MMERTKQSSAVTELGATGELTLGSGEGRGPVWWQNIEVVVVVCLVLSIVQSKGLRPVPLKFHRAKMPGRPGKHMDISYLIETPRLVLQVEVLLFIKQC